MKKTLLILAAIVFAVTACEKQTYVDGTYTATFDEPHYGWTDFLTVTLENDAVTEVDFDGVNDAGDLKSTDSAYNANMWANSDPQNKPELFTPAIEAALSNATIIPEYEEIDAVTGATGASENANLLMEAILDIATEGDVSEVVISYPAE
ncbi:MAG: hypothetical protein P1P82_13615 [Bacteroidales bacterium]|nr:hypothetical protein [Bacteroidales bacterium]MDT8431746.1 hypothetical protein [Bacteroidales bacterium]